jgi:hypothetical protein
MKSATWAHHAAFPRHIIFSQTKHSQDIIDVRAQVVYFCKLIKLPHAAFRESSRAWRTVHAIYPESSEPRGFWGLAAIVDNPLCDPLELDILEYSTI